MLSELDRINFIVSELLVLAKPQATHFKPQDLRSLIFNVITLLESQANLDNIQFKTLFQENISYTIHCEENQLKQVFINLLKNAMEAMSFGGEILVKSRRYKDSEILLQIIDQGCGIPQDQIPKVGDPFFTTKENGTGLGLMVTNRILEAHHCKMEIQSQWGVGTIVNLFFPVSDQQE